HPTALADIAAAEKLGTNAPRPPWLGLVTAFCRTDHTELARLAEAEPTAPLPVFLQLLLASPSEFYVRRLEAAGRMLARRPTCERAFGVVLTDAPVDAFQQAAPISRSGFSQVVRERLPAVPDVSRRARDLAVKEVQGLSAEMSSRSEIVEELREAGRA